MVNIHIIFILVWDQERVLFGNLKKKIKLNNHEKSAYTFRSSNKTKFGKFKICKIIFSLACQIITKRDNRLKITDNVVKPIKNIY